MNLSRCLNGEGRSSAPRVMLHHPVARDDWRQLAAADETRIQDGGSPCLSVVGAVRKAFLTTARYQSDVAYGLHYSYPNVVLR